MPVVASSSGSTAGSPFAASLAADTAATPESEAPADTPYAGFDLLPLPEGATPSEHQWPGGSMT